MRNTKKTLAGLLAALSLSACTTTGGIAGKGSAVDWVVTLDRTCTTLRTLDVAFKAVAPPLVEAGKITADQVAIEAQAGKLVANLCDPAHRPTDLAGAVASLALATVDMTKLVDAVK